MICAGAWVRAAAFLSLGLFCGSGCREEAPPRGGAKGGVAAGTAGSSSLAKREVRLVWPTPNDVYLRGGGLEDFVQPTVSGELRSGLFGSVRSGGRQFHEGLDLFPAERDRKGEALDPVFAAMAGVVVHVSAREGASSFGRYVVLEHPAESPPLYTLYAHLGRIDPGVARGRVVEAGESLGTMGRSAGGYVIPKERAHLHFEIGVRMTDRFEEWYRMRGFGNPNEHGLWNGMNLMGLDPLEFYARSRAGGLRNLGEILAAQPVAARVRVARTEEPDYARRYPSLVSRGWGTAELAGGWELDLNVTGVPLRLRSLPVAEFVGWKPGEVRVIEADTALLAANRARRLVRTSRGKLVPDDDLVTVVEQLWVPTRAER